MATSRWLIVVQPNQSDLYEALRQSIKDDSPVMVIYDRRFRERRRGSESSRGDRRRTDRRQRRPGGWLYECEVLRIEPAEDTGAAAAKRREAPPDVGTRACPECGVPLEFEMPRFPQPPARLEIQTIHAAARGPGVQHYVEIQAFSATGRPLLLQRNQARRRTSP